MSRVLEEYAALEARVLAALREDLGEAEFDALALKVHAFQRRWNGPYGNFCVIRPEPRNWREIPATPQSAFKRFALSVAPRAVTKTFRTSGTTGEGFGEHHFVNTRLYDAAILAGWDRLALPEATLVILTPRAEAAPHSSLAHMFTVLAEQRGGGRAQFALDANGALDLSLLAATFAQGKPVALLGTALAFVHLFERLGEERLNAPAGSFALETGGYKGVQWVLSKPELYAQFIARLGLPAERVWNEYGMTELSSQFYTRGLDQVHEAGPWLRALVIDPETGGGVEVGGTGVLRIFDLANLGSVLAVETQDLAMRREIGFELLGRDPAALPRGCSRAADEMLQSA